jgi:hypothetical protein
MASTAADLGGVLASELERPVHVTYGQARRTVVQARERLGVLEVRLNGMFRDAPDEVQLALARWLRSGKRARKACTVLDTWIDERLARLNREQPRSVRIDAVGEVHDLNQITTELVLEHFAGELAEAPPPVTWGRRSKSRSRHTLRLGSYDYGGRVIRVHPVLDQAAVPRFFVRFVLFHELLHAALHDVPEVRGPGSRQRHHGPEFLRRERAHADYTRAVRWEKQHVQALIRSARSGRPLRVRKKKPTLMGLAQRLLFD